uniref:Uncharacterized protein n=1 Tax=Setaria digitata TaxID=48799 RepID=A0A915PCP0_9BILA
MSSSGKQSFSYGEHFNNFTSEESHVTESYERNIHGVPELGRQREYSYSTYSERRIYGRNENGEVVVHVEKNPKTPVRPVSPVRPVTPVEASGSLCFSKKTSQQLHRNDRKIAYNRRNKLSPSDGHRPVTPVQPFDILPVSIPRIEIDKAIFDVSSRKRSPRPDDSPGYLSHSTCPGTGGVVPSVNVISTAHSIGPLKKVTKESRWVSVYDGRPVSPYVRTVTYAPKFSNQEYMIADKDCHCSNGHNMQPKQVTYKDESYSSRANAVTRANSRDACSVFIENPFYSD